MAHNHYYLAMVNFRDEHIWLIGASSGIGAALARELAAGGATLILSARRELELQQLNRELGGGHRVLPLEVAEAAAVQAAAHSIHQQAGKIDRVIFLAAIYRPAEAAKRDAAFARQLVEVNLLGGIYVSEAVLPIFEQQGRGQLALCASAAGFTGMPGGQPYSATKAALINYAESLYAEVEEGIDIKLINPGFVRTRITDKNRFHMPMLLEPEAAAKHIACGLQSRRFEIHFPKPFTLLVKSLRLLPYPLTLAITRRLRGRA